MNSRLTAVPENLGVGAAGVFKGIAQNRHAVEGSVVADCLSHVDDGAVVPGEPVLVEGHGAEWGANDAAKKVGLHTRHIQKHISTCSRPVSNIRCTGPSI